MFFETCSFIWSMYATKTINRGIIIISTTKKYRGLILSDNDLALENITKHI